jgi:hypothetical protein
MQSRLVVTTLMALALAGGPASAAIMKATFTGTVTFGPDPEGLFGPPGGSLTGKSAMAVFRYDTTLGSFVSGPGNTNLVGGPTFGVPTNESLGSWLRIGGAAMSLDGGHGFEVYQQFSPAPFEVLDFSETVFPGTPGSDDILSADVLLASAPPADLDQPFSLAVTSGRMDLQYTDGTGGHDIVMSGDSLTVAAAPEPASWALMLLGTGALGATARRRRQVP